MSESIFKGRREDQRLLTGAGRYASDWNLPGQLYACFLRSDRAHAKILSIDVAAARAHPGVAAVYTGADTAVADFKTLRSFLTFPGRDGQMLKTPTRPVLARERVRFVGEEVALVVADTALAAQDAAELIAVEYEELPVLAHPADALAPGAVRLYDDVEGNLCFDYEYGDEAATAAAFARAAHVTRLAMTSQRVVGNPMEPRACVVSWDGASGCYDLYLPNQGVTLMRAGLCAITGLPPDSIRLHPLDVGGGFGVRSSPQPEFPALMFAAKALARPVKWTASRSESFASDNHGRAIEIEGELALDAEGNFLAIRMGWLCDQGAYLTPAGPFINTANASATVVGCYRIAAAYGRHRLALTNTTPTAAYRGAGRPDMAYAVERLVDQAAMEMKLDRIELRRRNFIPKEAFPYTGPASVRYDSADFEGLLQLALKESDWAGFAGRREAARVRGRLRGLGCAVFLEPSGGGQAPQDQVRVAWQAGERLALYTVTQSQGQGHETVYPEIVAQVLGIPAERIDLLGGDIEGSRGLTGTAAIGSRSIMHHGSALKLAALEVVKKGLPLAARKLEAAAEDIEFRSGTYYIKGSDRGVSLLELVRAHAGEKPHPLDAAGEQPVARAFPSGAHVAEVEIDPDTGETQVIAYIAVDDCGVVINHTLAQGQIHGGVLQGAGQVFGEHAIYDRDSGQLLNGSFMDYTMPRADLIISIRDLYHLVPSPGNFLGAKGIGEAGTTGALPALMNAMMDALRPLGVTHLDMPASADRVWQAISRAKRKA